LKNVKNGATSPISGLECRVGRGPVAIPVAHIEQLIEYESSPLPLTRRWIAGVGLHQDRLVLTVGLVSDGEASPTRGPRRTRAILLHQPGSQAAWALEVTDVRLFVRATRVETRRTPDTDGLPAWISRARIEDGRSIGWIDVPAMLLDLGSERRRGV
jgi:chemotaxis signal transduction protein